MAALTGSSGLSGLGGVAGGWLPDVLPSLAAWYTAGPQWCFTDAAGTAPCGDGDQVRVWRDRHRNAWNLEQATAGSRPTLRLAGGRWAVRFDGVDDSISHATAAVPLTPLTALACASFTGSNFSRLLSLGGTTSGVEWYRRNTDPGALRFERTGTASSNTDSTSTWSSGVRRAYCVTNTTTARAFFVNGAADGGGNYSNTYSGTGVTLGAKRDGTGPFPIDVAGALLYGAVLTAAEIRAASDYLNGLV